MSRINATQAFTPAWNHMVDVLFRPFRMRLWLALGFVSLFAGGGGGGANFNSGFPGGGGSSSGGDSGSREFEAGYESVKTWIIAHWPVVLIGAIAFIGLIFLFGWLSSVMRFVYLRQVINKSEEIKRPFARYRHLGTSFFLWSLGFGLIFLLALGVLVGLPLWAAISSGNAGAIVSAAIWSILAGLALIFSGIMIGLFGEDFVIPVMYLRNVRILAAWKQVIPLIRANAGGVAVYVLLLIVIGIVAGIAALFLMIPVIIVVMIPGGILAVIGYMIYTSTGALSPGFIAYVSIAGLAVLILLSYLSSCVMQPIGVFRRAYSLVVLGQADPNLVTVPLGNQPPPRPYGQESV